MLPQMAPLNQGTSAYHHIHAIYTRDPTQGTLLGATGHRAEEVKASWRGFLDYAILHDRRNEYFIQTGGVRIHVFEIYLNNVLREAAADSASVISDLLVPERPARGFQGTRMRVYEVKLATEHQVRGVLMDRIEGCAEEKALCDWAGRFLVSHARLEATAVPYSEQDDEAAVLAVRITHLFARTLMYTMKEMDTKGNTPDRWEQGGFDAFARQVFFFTSRGLRVEFVLPAFPCKSSNLNRVSGYAPDKAEEIALRTLWWFTMDVEEYYPPGARITIVSDGIAVADCLGMHDEFADQYFAHLNVLKEEYFPSDPRIELISLHQLLEDKNGNAAPNNLPIDLPSYTETTTTEAAVNVRKLVIATAGIDDSAMRKAMEGAAQVKRNKEAAVAAMRKLQRQRQLDGGTSRRSTKKMDETAWKLHQTIRQDQTADEAFAAMYTDYVRFHMEDLADNPLRKLHPAHRQRLASSIGWEMILRHQAISNLLTVLFPHAVRFSVHALPNNGPAFAVDIMSRYRYQVSAVRAVRDFAPVDRKGVLQIPAPWNGCIAKIHGAAKHMLTTSGAVRDSIAEGAFLWEWTHDGGPAGTKWFRLQFTRTEAEHAWAKKYGAEQWKALVTGVGFGELRRFRREPLIVEEHEEPAPVVLLSRKKKLKLRLARKGRKVKQILGMSWKGFCRFTKGMWNNAVAGSEVVLDLNDLLTD
ncbi:hypothetical protein ASPZODRAFT_16627 [Penicilliopsis zonata CBS 506.65]|uniref:Uncharacterized protein n=1 Tax=Penicilliopsis zonata CBS 506.65 TaxID=1073090 RepID=A0A1L9SFU5_9EURO|nr:hypothetical protein ASPZODRAFT_16627 [Penicilliopsis zonata CBS 506.65]OJJ46031.1 hypothetical protein ASPZODRAFT_16627 [Penicilliopsis zonata CBS 506.65]